MDNLIRDNLQKITEKLILNDVASNVFENDECNSETLLKAYFIEMMNSDSYKEIKLFIADQIDFSQIVSLINLSDKKMVFDGTDATPKDYIIECDSDGYFDNDEKVNNFFVNAIAELIYT